MRLPDVVGVLMLLLGGALSGAAPAELAQTAQGTVAGVVVDAQSGRPIPGASVSLSPRDGRPPVGPVKSDDNGRFEFSGLLPGAYSILAGAPSYLPGSFGQDSPSAREKAAEIAMSEARRDFIVRLWRAGSVTGLVESSGKAPLGGESVVLLRPTIFGGHTTLKAVQGVVTGPDGRFAFAGVTPGLYFAALRAKASVVGRPGHAQQYFPQTPVFSGASAITVSAGRETAEINFWVALDAGHKISGSISGVPESAGPVRLQLVPDRFSAMDSDLDVRETTASPQGRFEFEGVFAGSYVLRTVVFPARSRTGAGAAPRFSDRRGMPASHSGPLPVTPAEETLSADEAVVVSDRDISGLVLIARPGYRVSGRVVFSGKNPPAPETLPTRGIYVRSVDGRNLSSLPVARIEPDGTFTTVGLPRGEYVLGMMEGFPGWSVLSIRKGRDEIFGQAFVVDSAIDDIVITLTDQPAELRGRVLDASGRPVPDAPLVVFPADPRLWKDFTPISSRMRAVATNRDGVFTLVCVPGDYLVASLASIPEPWQATSVLQEIAKAATTVRIKAGEAKSIEVRESRRRGGE